MPDIYMFLKTLMNKYMFKFSEDPFFNRNEFIKMPINFYKMFPFFSLNNLKLKSLNYLNYILSYTLLYCLNYLIKIFIFLNSKFIINIKFTIKLFNIYNLKVLKFLLNLFNIIITISLKIILHLLFLLIQIFINFLTYFINLL